MSLSQSQALRPRTTLRHALQVAGVRFPCAGAKVGLLGGSFHPPHQGHILLAVEALRTLQLDAVWFLPAPRNPLKESPATSAEQRSQELAQCLRAYAPARNRLFIVPLQEGGDLWLTSDTLALLHRAAPKVRFVWIGGADLLAELHQWHKWQNVVQNTPLAFFDRRSHTASALRGRISMRYQRQRLKNPARLAVANPPAWTLVRQKTSPLAGREIRA